LAAAERNPNVTPEQLAILRHKYGLDQPLTTQYVKWMGQLLQGDLGESIKMHRPVSTLIAERLPNTLLLVGVSFLVTILIAIPVGVYSAIKQYSLGDYVITTLTFVGQSIPIYWFGLILILVFYVWLSNPFTGEPIFPGGGMYSIDQESNLLDRLWHLVLPVTMLSMAWIAWYSRFLRGSMLEVIHSDYIRTARAKGLGERAVRYGHALKNAAIPLLTLVALDLPALFGGALFTEMVFSWPGMGRLFWDAARARDYPILLAIVLVNSFLIVLFNLVADLGYGFLDPRIRYATRET
jgi:peptide/nickel transport system permease protein